MWVEMSTGEAGRVARARAGGRRRVGSGAWAEGGASTGSGAWIGSAVLAAALAIAIAIAMPARGEGLVVHEWGTFTTLAGADGTALDWRPLDGPSDLPGFVYTLGEQVAGLRHRGSCATCGHAACGCGEQGCRAHVEAGDPRCPCKGCLLAPVRMETPVIYFYGGREQMEVSVQVGFPEGRITEWYPRARAVEGGIDWGRFALLGGEARAQAPLLREPGPSHYYPARDVAADAVRVCSVRDGGLALEHERFLFYRGVGDFALPIAARRVGAEGEAIEVRNQGAHRVEGGVLFERQGDLAWFRALGALEPGATRRALRPGHCCAWLAAGEQASAASAGAPSARAGAPQGAAEGAPRLGAAEAGDLAGTGASRFPAVRAALLEMLVGQGLYEDEAAAMLATWEDTWFDEGLRVFYLVPRARVDEVLPLTIDPPPASVVRVLVGRTDLVTPEREQALRQALRQP